MMDALRSGIDFFNRGLYYEAHETWEDCWREAPEGQRLFCQGLVQIAVGLHHLNNGNASGGVRVLARGISNLEPYPEHYLGIDRASLVRDTAAFLKNPGSARAPQIQVVP